VPYFSICTRTPCAAAHFLWLHPTPRRPPPPPPPLLGGKLQPSAHGVMELYSSLEYSEHSKGSMRGASKGRALVCWCVAKRNRRAFEGALCPSLARSPSLSLSRSRPVSRVTTRNLCDTLRGARRCVPRSLWWGNMPNIFIFGILALRRLRCCSLALRSL
jgi:hypothetical protein